jgi:hypothetical protein
VVFAFTVRLVPAQSSTINQQRELLQAARPVTRDKASLYIHTVLAMATVPVVHDNKVPAAVICNLAQQHAQHACFGVLVVVKQTLNCSPYMAESKCCTDPVCSSIQDSLQRAATARLELENLSVNFCMLVMVSRSDK